MFPFQAVDRVSFQCQHMAGKQKQKRTSRMLFAQLHCLPEKNTLGPTVGSIKQSNQDKYFRN